jgi:hypothetical protein
MRRTIGQTVSMAIAVMGLVVTSALAQPTAPGQTMICTKVDASGYCMEAKAKDDKVIIIKTEGVKVGEQVSCTTTGTSTTCTKVTTVKYGRVRRPLASPAGLDAGGRRWGDTGRGCGVSRVRASEYVPDNNRWC